MPSYLIAYEAENIFWKDPIYYFPKIFREYPPLILFVGLLGFSFSYGLRVYRGRWRWEAPSPSS
jgi:hypothetical protein